MAECTDLLDIDEDDLAILNKSFDEISIGEDEATTSLQSTPKSARKKLDFGGSKRDLTPKSKFGNIPNAKRFHIGGKPSGKEIKERQRSLEARVKELFEEKADCSIPQRKALLLLGIENASLTMLTTTLNRVFPSVRIKRTHDGGACYVNIRTRSLFSSSLCQGSPESESTDEIHNLKMMIASTNEVMGQIWEQAVSIAYDNEELTDLMDRYSMEAQEKDVLFASLVKLYEKELEQLKSNQNHYALSHEQIRIIKEEFQILESITSMGVRTNFNETLPCQEVLNKQFFKTFVQTFVEKCPLLQSIIECLLVSNLHQRNVTKTVDYKVLCGTHALALLMNIRNAKSSNDFPLLFGLLCISYGGGKQFINMIHAIGLSLHWDTIMNYLTKRLDNFQLVIDQHVPKHMPVIFLMDNVNLYRGNKRHLRLLKNLGPLMWNLTVRGVLIPNTDSIKELLDDKNASEEPQQPIKDLLAEELFIENNPDHLAIWNKVKDFNLLNILDVGLNMIPQRTNDFEYMDETDFDSWLLHANFENCKDNSQFHIDTSNLDQEQGFMACEEKSDTLILPLSLEDNSTLVGGASCLEEFGKEFEIPCKHNEITLDFDEKTNNFSIESARNHSEFLYLLQEHKKEMVELEKKLTSVDKNLSNEFNTWENDEDEKDEDEQEVEEEVEEECADSVQGKKNRFQRVDGKFRKIVDSIYAKIWNAHQSTDPDDLTRVVQHMQLNRKLWEDVTDHHGRSILHHAVEEENLTLVQTLLNIGMNPNIKEKCGATPLTLAIIKGNVEIVKLLLESFVEFGDKFYTNVPSPKVMAEMLKSDTIGKLLEDLTTKESDSDSAIWKLVEVSMTGNTDNNKCSIDMVEEDKDVHSTTFSYDRSMPKIKTLVVGDQGTNKINRSVREKSSGAYGWVGEVPGDMHAKGYILEVCKKTMGPGGFMCILHHVLKRKKLNDAAFGDKKFQHQNLGRIDEAVRDVYMAYGLAAVQLYKKSDSFPSDKALRLHYQQFGNHNQLLLDAFKVWLAKASKDSVCFAYQSQLITLFGPLRQLYISSIRNGNGLAREAAWMLMLPLFAQSQKRNYWVEAFVHVVNLVAAWPLTTRKLLQQNCSINVKGKQGHCLALDEWVETYMVLPLKKYASGHSSIHMLKRLMVNVDAFSTIRDAYSDKSAFNVHPTSHHKEQDPLPDQLKGMWYCLKHKIIAVNVTDSTIPKLTKEGGDSGKIQQSLINVYAKGQEKVKQNFSRMMYAKYNVFIEDPPEEEIDEEMVDV